jgi:4-hydroxybenzoate polyprenyltransferase
LKLINTIISWHISLAIAAVLLTVSAQIQLGLKPQWQPFLFLIFSGTLFEYNRHRVVILFFQGGALNSGKYELIRKKQKIFFLSGSILGIAFVAAALSTKTGVLLTFLLLGFLTLFYSGLGFGNKKHLFKLREIPYLKIFLITSIWSVSTILLPVIQAGNEILNTNVIFLFAERFLFIFSIAIQFDIRDMQADRRAGLKTIPLLIGQHKATILSFLTLAASVMSI